MISNLHKNCMGTVSFDGKFDGMRKAQDFIVYPIHNEADAQEIQIQSDTRIGRVRMSDGRVMLSPSRKGGSYGVHLMFATHAGKLEADELLLLKAHIMSTAHGAAGKRENGFIQTDNSGALAVFGA